MGTLINPLKHQTIMGTLAGIARPKRKLTCTLLFEIRVCYLEYLIYSVLFLHKTHIFVRGSLR